MSPKQILESCVTWQGLIPVLLAMSLGLVTASAWIVQVHAEGTHNDHVTRQEYEQLIPWMMDRFDRLENKLDRLEPR